MESVNHIMVEDGKKRHEGDAAVVPGARCTAVRCHTGRPLSPLAPSDSGSFNMDSVAVQERDLVNVAVTHR